MVDDSVQFIKMVRGSDNSTRNVTFLPMMNGRYRWELECGVCMDTYKTTSDQATPLLKRCWSCKNCLCQDCFRSVFVEADDMREYADRMGNIALTKCPFCKQLWHILEHRVKKLPFALDMVEKEYKWRYLHRLLLEAQEDEDEQDSLQRQVDAWVEFLAPVAEEYRHYDLIDGTLRGRVAAQLAQIDQDRVQLRVEPEVEEVFDSDDETLDPTYVE